MLHRFKNLIKCRMGYPAKATFCSQASRTRISRSDSLWPPSYRKEYGDVEHDDQYCEQRPEIISDDIVSSPNGLYATERHQCKFPHMLLLTPVPEVRLRVCAGGKEPISTESPACDDPDKEGNLSSRNDKPVPHAPITFGLTSGLTRIHY